VVWQPLSASVDQSQQLSMDGLPCDVDTDHDGHRDVVQSPMTLDGVSNHSVLNVGSNCLNLHQNDHSPDDHDSDGTL